MREPLNSKKDELSGALMKKLTDDQKKLLLQALEIVKQQVFSESVKRFRNYLIIAVSLITIFGAISVVGLKTAIKDATVGALREDASLRQSIKDDAAAKVTKAEDLLKQITTVLELSKNRQVTETLATRKELERLLSELKNKTQEDNLLFERSARELRDLVVELKQLK